MSSNNLPTSKWFTIEYDPNHTSLYDVTLNLDEPFTKWVLANYWDSAGNNNSVLVAGIKYEGIWYLNTKQLQEFLTDAEQQMDEMYARYQAEFAKDGLL